MIEIDWDNLPICSEGLVLSPNFCLVAIPPYPPVDPPHGNVPVPSALPLFVLGLVMMKVARRKS